MSTFFRLTPGSRVRIGVPVHVVNREASPGLKKGGALNLVLHTVEVMAPADAIPESVTIDLTGLDFHDSVHVSDLKLPEGCKPVSSKTDQTVVTIVPPTVMAEEAPAAAAPAATTAARPRPPPTPRRRRSGQGQRPLPPPQPRPQLRPPSPPRSKADKTSPGPAGRGFGPFAARALRGRNRSGAAMLLIAGLGNPGQRHARNRHNIGFMALAAIAGAHRIGPFRARFSGPGRGGRDRRRSASIAACAADLHERIRPQRRRSAALP